MKSQSYRMVMFGSSLWKSCGDSLSQTEPLGAGHSGLYPDEF